MMKLSLLFLLLCLDRPAMAQAERPSPRRSPETRSAPQLGVTQLGVVKEEDSESVTFTGSWSTNTLPANSGGRARLSMEAGARATFTFIGESVSWIGYRDEWSGIAKVWLDGALQDTVDTYAKTATAQAVLYSATGLRDGRHTLSIEVAGNRNKAAAASWVWIDGFAVQGPDREPASRGSDPGNERSQGSDRESASDRRDGNRRNSREDGGVTGDERAAIEWTGAWSINHLKVHRGGDARLSMDPEARASFEFSGTGVRWIGYRDEWSGTAQVFLDGRLQSTVDTYSSPAQAQAVIYSVAGLRPGPHTLVIKPSGTHRPRSQGSWVWVDDFEVSR